MKKLLFCNLKYDLPQCRKEPGAFYLPHGLGIIMDIAMKKSINYDYFDTYLHGNTKTFLQYYQKQKHDVCLFSAIVGNYAYPYLKYVFTKIKEINPSVCIVLGGPITSIYPKILLEELPVDIIVIGEGEEAFTELVEAEFSLTKLPSILGIGYQKKGIFINDYRSPLESPLEQKSCNPLFQHESLEILVNTYVERQKRLNRGWDLSASRGCFGNCTFCKKVFDKPLRYFSADYILEVMSFIKHTYGIRKFNFMDENFITNRKNFKEFLDSIVR